MWPDIIKKSKEGGLDVIETYVFWNYHEPVKGKVWSSGLSKCNGTIYDVYNGRLPSLFGFLIDNMAVVFLNILLFLLIGFFFFPFW